MTSELTLQVSLQKYYKKITWIKQRLRMKDAMVVRWKAELEYITVNSKCDKTFGNSGTHCTSKFILF